MCRAMTAPAAARIRAGEDLSCGRRGLQRQDATAGGGIQLRTTPESSVLNTKRAAGRRVHGRSPVGSGARRLLSPWAGARRPPRRGP
jgi:hypothetical protein